MKTFEFSGRTRDGNRVTSSVHALNKVEAMTKIEAMGVIPNAVTERIVQAEPVPLPAAPVQIAPAKQRDVYLLLALFLGGLGIHDFYAGRVNYGVMILLMTILGMVLVPWLYIVVFAIVVYEMITVRSDATGVRMVQGSIKATRSS